MKKKNFNNIIYSKKTNFLIGFSALIITIVTSIISYIQIPKIDLCYAAMPEITLSPCGCLSNKFKIFWGNKQVDNVKLKPLVFWNNGDQYVDNQLLKNDIRVIPTKNCKILDIIDFYPSRENLKLNFEFWKANVKTTDKNKISNKFKSDILRIVIQEKESLENKDGAKFSIIYSSKDVCNFVFDADVKGKPSAFRKIETNYFYYLQSKVDLLLFLFIIIIPYLFALKRLFFPLFDFTEYIKAKFKKHSTVIILFYHYLIFIYKIILIPVFSYGIFKFFYIVYTIIKMPNWI